jgi:hypothetical protein
MRVCKKIIACFLSVLMVLPLGMSTSFGAVVQETGETQNTSESSERLYEVVELREKNSKTYQLSDGTFQYVGSAEDIHYEDEDGSLKEINNAITDKPGKEGYVYSNTANSWHAYFSDSLCEKNAVVLEKDNYQIAFSITGAKSQSKATKSSVLDKSESMFDEMLVDDNRVVVYKDVFEAIDVAYTTRTNGVKEEIILRNALASYVFEFDFTLNGLSVLEKEGSILFADSEGQSVFSLEPLYMEDANGKYSEKVKYTIEKNEDGCKITIIADEEYLNASDTQYPVIIDPSIIISGSLTSDTCVDQQYPSSNYNASVNLWTGGLYNTNAMRTYIKFYLPTNIPAANVTSAYLRIKQNAYATPTIRANKVTEPWSITGITWNNRADYTTVNQSGIAIQDAPAWYRMYTTAIVQEWLDGDSNYGFCVREYYEDNTNQKTRYYSSNAPYPNRPELVINFSSYNYYGPRPYTFMQNVDINCVGYANYYSAWGYLNPTYEGLNACTSEAELWSYSQNLALVWLSAHKSGKYRLLSSYDSYIYSDEWRVVFRMGYQDLNQDGVIFFSPPPNTADSYDCHLWFQTSTGQWAEKSGIADSNLVSGTNGTTNPYNVNWPDGSIDYFYHSDCMYFAIKY